MSTIRKPVIRLGHGSNELAIDFFARDTRDGEAAKEFPFFFYFGTGAVTGGIFLTRAHLLAIQTRLNEALSEEK